MFRWNEDMIRFLRDASEQSDYHRLLAETLVGRLPADAHVCDAGCGLGYLSLRLAPYCRRVTAVDVCEETLAVLRENCAKEGITNITPRCGEIDTLPPDAPYDAMVFCFFGIGREVLRLARAQCRGPVILIKKAWQDREAKAEPRKLCRYACASGGAAHPPYRRDAGAGNGAALSLHRGCLPVF